MNLKDLIEIVPDLLLLFVPGYVAVRIKEKYGLEKKSEHFDITLYSILFSFIIGIIYSIILFIATNVSESFEEILKISSVKQFLYIFLAVILGLFLTKIPSTKLGKFLLKVFNKNLSSEPSVWIKAMTNPNGAWATVYLENGLIYTGKLINYTCDPNEESKEILLYDFRLSVKNDSSSTKKDTFSNVIHDYTEGNLKTKVLLRLDDIIAIEIYE